MCGRYGLISDDKEIIDRFDIENRDFKLKPIYNIPPSLTLPVVERHSPNSLNMREWGVLLYDQYFTINARTDKLETNRIWKKSVQERRVIIPANYFYEWKREGKNKQPYLFRLKNNELFGFAGFLVDFKNKEGEERTGFVLLTTEANEIMRPIHDRLPCILKKEDEDEWLNPDTVELEHLMKFLDPYPSDEMEMFAVSSLVNSPANNNPDIIKPLK